MGKPVRGAFRTTGRAEKNQDRSCGGRWSAAARADHDSAGWHRCFRFLVLQNFTLLACFPSGWVGLRVAGKHLALRLVAPMLALFVVAYHGCCVTNVGATTELFSGLPMQEQTQSASGLEPLNWQDLLGRSE